MCRCSDHSREMRVVEKHLRDEVINRCLEFLDVAIHFVLHREHIYSHDLFEKRLKYNLLVFECQDADVQHYIYEFLNHLKPFFRKQLIDQIGFVIWKDDEDIVFRRYLFELHPIIDQPSNTMHKDGHQLLAELDSVFSDCLKELMRQQPDTSTDQIHWKLQTRLCRHGTHSPEIDETFVEQFQLAEDLSVPIQPIKSLHAQRLHLQLMRQDQERPQP